MSGEPRLLEVGEEIPSLEIDTTNAGSIALDELRGSWVVIWFYVRSNTPG